MKGAPWFAGPDHHYQTLWITAVGKCVTAVAPPPSPTTSLQPNRPPVVSAIEAVANPPTTVYTISVDDPDGDKIFYVWSGANCGKTTGVGEAKYTWEHGDEGCEHGGVGHDDATISVLVTDGFFEFRCTYVGADTGKGEACVQQ